MIDKQSIGVGMLSIAIFLLFIAQAYVDRVMLMRLQATNTYLTGIMDDITSYKLYDPANAVKVMSLGVYFSGAGYYCVKTEGRDYQDIRWTDLHENCHAFVDMDYGHFCNNSNQSKRDIDASLKKVKDEN